MFKAKSLKHITNIFNKYNKITIAFTDGKCEVFNGKSDDLIALCLDTSQDGNLKLLIVESFSTRFFDFDQIDLIAV